MVSLLFFLLMIGSCVFIGKGMWQLINLPDYVSKENIQKTYGEDIKNIEQMIYHRKPLNKVHADRILHDDILAVYMDTKRSMIEVYSRVKVERHGMTLSANCGIATLLIDELEVECLVYKIYKNRIAYIIYIKDRLKPNE